MKYVATRRSWAFPNSLRITGVLSCFTHFASMTRVAFFGLGCSAVDVTIRSGRPLNALFAPWSVHCAQRYLAIPSSRTSTGPVLPKIRRTSTVASSDRISTASRLSASTSRHVATRGILELRETCVSPGPRIVPTRCRARTSSAAMQIARHSAARASRSRSALSGSGELIAPKDRPARRISGGARSRSQCYRDRSVATVFATTESDDGLPHGVDPHLLAPQNTSSNGGDPLTMRAAPMIARGTSRCDGRRSRDPELSPEQPGETRALFPWTPCAPRRGWGLSLAGSRCSGPLHHRAR